MTLEKKIKMNAVVCEPVELSTGVFRTNITHPKLEGHLYFIHGVNNRDQTLGAIQNSIVDDITEVTKNISELVNSMKKKNKM